MIYRLIGAVLSTEIVFKYLLKRAKRTPMTPLYGHDNGELYMERYWLFNPLSASGNIPKYPWLPLGIRLHKIVKADDDRHMHDHPWNVRTFILKGSYTEQRPYPITKCNNSYHHNLSAFNIAFHRTRGDSAALKFDEYHKITSVSDGGVYTLFVTGKYRGVWGFLVDGVKVTYKKYLNLD